MSVPLTRRQLGETVAASVVAAAAGDAVQAEPPRPPLTAPKPPVPRGIGVQAALLYEVLLSQFPESRVEAKRPEIARQIATNLYYGQILAETNLTNADGPGPLWAAYRAGDLIGRDRNAVEGEGG
ncbi:hypothetical protein [Alienimonas californiensis]|uniref:Uncharacterized protein n=1 Tax=Alienimonas californiensis TaxID=2527989 RepID=A0A517P8R6_9PLAN|nr:hypothetical protein [Alienimonas californiensis]QDT15769.1 hypothetical protein CA12_18630 [Alienimonas californiensis]